MIRALAFTDGRVQTLEATAVAGALRDATRVLWIDVEAPTQADGDFLGRTFGFHALALSDSLSQQLEMPKLDDFGSYQFLVVHGIDHNLLPGELDTHELDIFLGANYLVTSHIKASRSITITQEACRQTPELLAKPDFLAYWIISHQVDEMLPPVEAQASLLYELKAAILRDPQPSQLRTALELEEKLLRVRRAIIPEMRVMDRMAKNSTPLVSESTRPYFSDIRDHLERLQSQIDMLWDMAESNLALHLSATANRTADFTKALSLVAMIFLPLALVAGVYGMNFKNMPELDWKYGYFLILGTIIGVGVGLLLLYRKKHWI